MKTSDKQSQAFRGSSPLSAVVPSLRPASRSLHGPENRPPCRLHFATPLLHAPPFLLRGGYRPENFTSAPGFAVLFYFQGASIGLSGKSGRHSLLWACVLLSFVVFLCCAYIISHVREIVNMLFCTKVSRS